MIGKNLFGELIFELFLLFFGVLYFIKTITFQSNIMAKIFPITFSIIFIIVIIIILKNTIAKMLDENKEKSSTSTFQTINSAKKFFAVYIGSVLLITLTFLFSYWIAILLVLPLCIYILDNGRWSTSLFLLPLGMIITIYIIFIKFLGVRLPTL